MYIRKITAILVSVSIMLSSTAAIFAQDTSDLQLTADRLNKIGVIAGDGNGNYNLDGSLKRTEASTFITKLMGKDAYVKENKDSLVKTVFSDVKETDWFAPYVGFCYINDIIDGYDGKFGSKDNLTEQAFLVMLLKLLKYTGTDDIKWNDNVFKTAYDAGLVTEQAYLTKTKDDGMVYTRGQAVLVMYRALSIKLKGDNKTLLQTLIENGAINRDIALASGILNDTIQTKIQEIVPLNGRKIIIKFNETINSIDAKNIRIYEENNENNNLAVSIVSHSGTQLEIETNTQLPDRIYKVEVTDAEDLEGNISGILTATFNGYTVTSIESDLFKISKAEQIGKNEIYVYFTQPINENVEFAPYYELYENGELYANGDLLTISFAGGENVASVILKGKSFSANKEYTLKISGQLVGAYGTTLGDGEGDSYSFIGKDMPASSLVLEKITAITGRSIQLDFNRQIHPLRAEQVYSYSVSNSKKNPIEVEKAELISDNVSNGKSVVLTLKTAFDVNETYNIMINCIQDSTKQYSIEEKAYSFSGYYSIAEKLAIKAVKIIDSGTVNVIFNKAIDYNSGLNVINYQIRNMGDKTVRIPGGVRFLNVDQTSIQLFLKREDYFVNNTPFDIEVLGSMKDYTGVSVINTISQTVFVDKVDETKLKINEAKIVGKDTVKVTFNKEISTEMANLKPQNYSIEYIEQGKFYKKVPIAITYFDDRSIVFRFNSLEADKEYIFAYGMVMDYAGNVVTGSDEDKAEIVIGK
ncbi:S-layer family protein [Ruminiclostridium sufflavum DSM 19573]|uniref:S-layer family protein n=1 Tax=Ruminiclostridium sufflavum DSM 19573 TaxID=1121337 RepID=A0A318XKT8_9FIRM|nr:S-layer homology domain-containing protein [Ruminiclostridium sufflavum]PYG87156.1 S-layer family protein [Ruminiclostridium sufflavum DSM 19573]